MIGRCVIATWLIAAAVATQSRVARPDVRVIQLPAIADAGAIWGASGADGAGRIWLGISSKDDKLGSAHLVELDPATGAVADRGDVNSQLQRLGTRRPGEIQIKIHSRIVEAPDGYLYFASMDESGEKSDGSKLPTWGGHLWRTRGPRFAWEHLARVPEALIATAAGGRFVYALGYFEHVVYQFDTKTRATRSVRVGSSGGHVSRNFFADQRGHVFVPRVSGGGAAATAALVELDDRLEEVASHPLGEYFERAPKDSHGIVAIHPADRAWLFVTGKGRLYRLEVSDTGASRVVDAGWFHPGGPRYAPSLFRDAATGRIFGVAYGSSWGSKQFEWVTRNPDGTSTVATLPYGGADEFPHGAVLYGSMTRDASGRFYVVGSMNWQPVALQVTPPGL